ncbi:hypothetical protein EGR_10774 [Echinococcus granulosus]|uniref:Uncharacterized protein n=1 Tax=Echinococcus granulosus TaxID=6210 RepID=W6ULF2_ECHGR|nr:hypothetical protein EGR_10774 [Echinococcus granulosus]EUB54364.1 hypothetical protein EGR_10774 [Echinococcus granulosus]
MAPSATHFHDYSVKGDLKKMRFLFLTLMVDNETGIPHKRSVGRENGNVNPRPPVINASLIDYAEEDQRHIKTYAIVPPVP